MKSVILTEYCWFQFWCVFKCGKKKKTQKPPEGSVYRACRLPSHSITVKNTFLVLNE